MKYYIFILISISIFSCKKAEDRACLKSTGETRTMEYIISEAFDTLYLFDNMEYTLIQSDTSKIVLTGGENLIPHIGWDVNQQRLTVQNNNTCNFLRSFKKKMNVEIHAPEIRYIHFEGSERLKNRDTIRSSELRIVIRDGAGPVEFNVDAGYLAATITSGFGNFTLSGKANIAFVSCFGNSFCDTRNLKVFNKIIASSNTVGDIHVNTENANLKVDIFSRGSVYYTGAPTSIEKQIIGTGELKQLP